MTGANANSGFQWSISGPNQQPTGLQCWWWRDTTPFKLHNTPALKETLQMQSTVVEPLTL